MSSMPSTPREESARDLPRRLTLIDAASIHVGNVLGSGIFVAPAAVAAAAPGVLPGMGLWVLTGVVALCGGFCYAECGTRLPRTGGFYVFYREVYGKPLAFVGGWAALLITYPASIAAIALIFGRYFLEVAPLVPQEATVVPAAAALLVVGAINVIGVRTAAWAQRLLTTGKVAALAAVCLAALAGMDRRVELPQAEATGSEPFLWATLLTAFVVMLWTYDGWSDISLVAGEVRDPGRILGRAVILGTAVLVLLYALVQAGVATLLPAGEAAASERVLSDAVQTGLGARSGDLVAAIIALATFGSINGIVLAASRLGFAMARDGDFFEWFGDIHPRFGTPARAVVVLVAATLVFVFSAGFRNLVGIFSFSVWIFYGLTAAALLVLRRRRAGEPLAWRAPGGPIAPLIVIATAGAMTTGLMAQSPGRSLLGLALLLAGFPAYVAWRKARLA